MNTETVLTALANTPNFVLELIGEIPAANLTRRPRPGKWSAHEHAVHLAEVHRLFFDRLELMMSEDNPQIKLFKPSSDDEDGAMLKQDLTESLNKFLGDREILLEKLRKLAPADWRRTAAHEEYDNYSIFMMARHFALHDNLHAFRIEEILLKKNWN